MERIQTYEVDAQMAPDQGGEYLPQNVPPQMMAGEQDQDMFARSNDLRVIQEYNREENLPEEIRKQFWGLTTKSIKLGFFEKDDEKDLYFLKNMINIGHIMARPKHKYTFHDRQQMNMLSMLLYADFKRAVGIDKWKNNERTLQAASVTQSIQGAGGAPMSRRSGVMGSLGRFFA